MTSNEFKYWLDGYTEGKRNLGPKQLARIKEMANKVHEPGISYRYPWAWWTGPGWEYVPAVWSNWGNAGAGNPPTITFTTSSTSKEIDVTTSNWEATS